MLWKFKRSIFFTGMKELFKLSYAKMIPDSQTGIQNETICHWDAVATEMHKIGWKSEGGYVCRIVSNQT